jgi:hypothetical protein
MANSKFCGSRSPCKTVDVRPSGGQIAQNPLPYQSRFHELLKHGTGQDVQLFQHVGIFPALFFIETDDIATILYPDFLDL